MNGKSRISIAGIWSVACGQNLRSILLGKLFRNEIVQQAVG